MIPDHQPSSAVQDQKPGLLLHRHLHEYLGLIFLIEIESVKNYKLELVNRLALEINPTVSGMSNSGRNGKNLAINYSYIKMWVLSKGT